LLQIENAVMNSRAQYSEARQGLQEIWRELVMALKFPRKWLEIDPEIIPMTIEKVEGGTVGEALALCGGSGVLLHGIPAESLDVNLAKKNAEASALSLESFKSAARPDLKLILELEANGIDSRFHRTWSEALALDHPEWTLGVALTVPMSGYLEEANVRRAFTQDLRSQALADKAQSDFEVSWINACADLQRIHQLVSEYEESSKKQGRRVELEERRFDLGRSAPLNIIQAGDDFTISEVNLHTTEAKARIAAWKIKKLAGKIPAYLNSLATTYAERLDPKLNAQ